MKRHNSAFTLIELLVVIAIIAILAAILFPVFAQAKMAAKKTQSLSNMKNITLATKIYENDYDDNIPVSQYCQVTLDDNTLQTWQDEIYPYVKAGNHNGDVTFGTGNGSADRNKASGIYADPGAPTDQSFPYGIHRDLSPDNWAPTCSAPGATLPSVSETSVDTPADKAIYILKGQSETGTAVDDGWGWIYFITDEWAWTSGVGISGGQPTNDNANLSDAVDCDGALKQSAGYVWNGCGMHPRYRYSGTSNWGFLDGHAKGVHKGQAKWFKNIYIDGKTVGLW
jgi:prepilin-type N-terminal cleavage/methylation domain-containing protein/prepilin-type processing-associated H-X9-DG protein